MDDPWGSPWADETIRTLPGDGDSKGTKEHLASIKGSLSPWDDDEASAGWSALPEVGVVTRSAHGKTSNIFDRGSILQESGLDQAADATSQLDDVTRPTWTASGDDQYGEQSELRYGKILDRAWSGEVSVTQAENRHGVVPLATDGFGSSKPRSVCEHTDINHTSPTSTSERVAAIRVASPDESTVQGVKRSTQHVEIDTVNDTDEPRGDAVSETEGELNKSNVIEQPSSRPSSSPSDRSHHEETLADSPRTSFDEEPKRPQLERQESSKVKQLVQLFDGLAVETADTSMVPRNTNADSDTQAIEPSNDSVNEGAEDDFGDFEDGVSYVSAVASDQVLSHKSEESKDVFTATQIEVPPWTSNPAKLTPAVDQRPSATLSVGRQVHVKFDADLSLLEQLYHQMGTASYSEKNEALGIDSMVSDTFSSVEQRKIWYRISRYGTMKKHNSGDDDYVRINWRRSIIRDETLKIVGRWMEEDRIGGGIMLGGGTKLGSIFSWGKPGEAPVSAALPQAGARRKSKPRPQTESFSTDGAGQNLRPLLKEASTSNSKHVSDTLDSGLATATKPPTATSAQFGWSTVMTGVAANDSISRSLKLAQDETRVLADAGSSSKTSLSPNAWASVPVSIDSSIGANAALYHPALAIETTASPHPLPHTDNILRPAAGDENDDWGDMVSLPTTTGPPLHPVRSGHKPSKSLVSVIATTSAASVHSLPTRPYHKPSSSEDILSPAKKEREPSTTKAPHVDAWSSADLSFFDGPTAPTGMAHPRPRVQPEAHLPAVSSGGGGGGAVVAQAPHRTAVEIEHDATVRGIVLNLPDLSYMLRR